MHNSQQVFQCKDCSFLSTSDGELKEHFLKTGHKKLRNLVQELRQVALWSLVAGGIIAIYLFELTEYFMWAS